MDDTDIIKRIVETGEVKVGSRSVSKIISGGKPKLVILSANCPKQIKEPMLHNAKATNIPLYTYGGTSLELGEACRKPFPISAMAVIMPGDADLAKLIKEAKA